MDANLVAISMHSLERIVAVLLGGMAVYYGYRLFLVLPVETRSDGKITLPGMSVVLAKAGPGLFFVAFGSLVILVSLFRPIKVVGPKGSYTGVIERDLSPTESARSGVGSPSASEQEVARINLALQSINCMRRLAGPKSAVLTQDMDQAVLEAKLALLADAWNADGWGDFEAFRSWATKGTPATSSPARAMFESQRADCSR